MLIKHKYREDIRELVDNILDLYSRETIKDLFITELDGRKMVATETNDETSDQLPICGICRRVWSVDEGDECHPSHIPLEEMTEEIWCTLIDTEFHLGHLYVSV